MTYIFHIIYLVYKNKGKHLSVISILHPTVVWNIPDSKVHVANMGPTWVLSAPGEPHVGPMNFAIKDIFQKVDQHSGCGSVVQPLENS